MRCYVVPIRTRDLLIAYTWQRRVSLLIVLCFISLLLLSLLQRFNLFVVFKEVRVIQYYCLKSIVLTWLLANAVCPVSNHK